VVARKNILARDYPRNFGARQRQGLHYSRICAIRRTGALENQSVTLPDNGKSEANPLSSDRASRIGPFRLTLERNREWNR
jgi:hypothetical protein